MDGQLSLNQLWQRRYSPPSPPPQTSKHPLQPGPVSGRSSAQLGCRSVPVRRAFSGSRCRGAGESTTAKSHAQTRCFFGFVVVVVFSVSLFSKENSAAFQLRPPRTFRASLEGSGSPHACPLLGSVFLPSPLTPPGLPARSLQLPPGCRKSSSDLQEYRQPSLFREDLAAPFDV